MSRISKSLSSLRKLLVKNNLAAFVIPSSDAHQNEYIAPSDMRREWITGFTGSAGVAVVMKDKAFLWTDPRYHIQASQELNEEWILMKQGLPRVPTLEIWLAKKLSPNCQVGIYPSVTGLNFYRSLAKKMKVTFTDDLVGIAWKERPSTPSNPIFPHPLSFAGEKFSSKVEKVRTKLKKKHCHSLIVTSLDEIAWLFNLRGSDIPFNPVFFSYAIVSHDVIKLYIDQNKIDDEILTHLGNKTKILPYNQFYQDCQELNAKLLTKHKKSTGQANKKYGKVWIDSNKCNLALSQSFDDSVIFYKESPIGIFKAIKNETEIKGMEKAHLQDAAAFISLFSWIEEQFKNNCNASERLDEIDVITKIKYFRSKQKYFVSFSFPPISGSGPNGAIIHYSPNQETVRNISKSELFLLDTGAHYLNGTTDTTRTIHFGQPTTFEKECFTRVLKGHIALATTVFPSRITGPLLDAIARKELWKAGLDYNHGTGHGVGAFLNVHEGPHGISSTTRQCSQLKTALQPGMVVTNEPGYYHEGAFGIRIENILVVKEIETPYDFQNQKYLGFESITMVPIQKKMIDIELLNEEEINWLNNYHQLCFDNVSPLLHGKALQWLKFATQPLFYSS